MKQGACLPVFYPEKRVLYKNKNLTRFKTTNVDNLLSGSYHALVSAIQS
jgi:hypothetical protein